MRIAYLIIAHQQPAQLARLVNALQCDWAHFFIHVDAKADVRVFQAVLNGVPRVTILGRRERVRVSWGGYSLMRAAMRLMIVATESSESFDRYALLSGACYPIKALQQMSQTLKGDTEFVRVDRRITGDRAQPITRNVNRYYLPDNRILNYLGKRSRRFARAADRLIAAVPRRPFTAFPLYHGSAFCVLTDAAARYVLDFTKTHHNFLRFLQTTRTSDEIFFQSILKQSPFASHISHDFERDAELDAFEHGAHYIDWSDADASSPKTLDMDDLPRLLSSRSAFARKFDEKRSSTLLDRIDQARASTIPILP
jgi:hypothetical protein